MTPPAIPTRRQGLLTTDFARLRDDPTITVVAEVMGGIEPAREHVLALLGAGKSVVSANKQLLSQHGDELFGAAERNGVQLRFEASVCAAIPVVKVLRESMIVTNVHRIDGIVNGTTNFILTRMIQSGAPYAEALAEAQALGYAEADPTEDVTGADAAAKIAILASIAFHTRMRLEEVEHVGINLLDLADVEHAAELGYAVKLIASAWRSGGAGGGAGASLPAGGEPPACGRGRRLQRGDAAGQLDPRGDPGGARCRRRRDGHGRDRRRGRGDRHPGHRLPAARRALPGRRPVPARPSAEPLLPALHRR